MKLTLSNKFFDTDLICEWLQLLKLNKWNWLEFHLLKLYFERNIYIGTSEIEFYLLGFGIRFYWVHNEDILNKQVKKWKKIKR